MMFRQPLGGESGSSLLPVPCVYLPAMSARRDGACENLLHGHLDMASPSHAGSQHKLQRKLTVSNMDDKIVAAKYAVRGTVVQRAAELKRALADGEALPFDELILCNIGNPHAVKQQPITFYRQVAAAMYMPELASDPQKLVASGLFPADVVERAQEYLKATGGSGVGSYTDSIGLQLVREQVAEFIQARDGFPADPGSITLTTGASEGVKRWIGALIAGERDGVMIPRPQYPLYSAALTMSGGIAVYYDLDEAKGWTTSWQELERAFQEAASAGTCVRALAMINPGNPVGAVLEEDGVALLVCFAASKGLVILADEVYQVNVYSPGKAFHSCKKVLRKLQAQQLMAPPEAGDASAVLDQAQLVSFHSTSKGLIGECGQRGGFMEMVGFSEATLAQFKKVAATSLSSNTIGQIFVGLMVKGPAPDSPSRCLFDCEQQTILDGLKRRALAASDALNKMPGISCQPIEGAMYAFPCIQLPAAMKEEGAGADEMWCISLMEATGIVCVPGSGFGQKPGTFHARLTILPPDDMFDSMLLKMAEFQKNLYEEWGPA